MHLFSENETKIVKLTHSAMRRTRCTYIVGVPSVYILDVPILDRWWFSICVVVFVTVVSCVLIFPWVHNWVIIIINGSDQPAVFDWCVCYMPSNWTLASYRVRLVHINLKRSRHKPIFNSVFRKVTSKMHEVDLVLATLNHHWIILDSALISRFKKISEF